MHAQSRLYIAFIAWFSLRIEIHFFDYMSIGTLAISLQLVHANVVDTALLYPHPKGTPYKSALRVLASRHLLRTIQRGADTEYLSYRPKL